MVWGISFWKFNKKWPQVKSFFICIFSINRYVFIVFEITSQSVMAEKIRIRVAKILMTCNFERNDCIEKIYHNLQYMIIRQWNQYDCIDPLSGNKSQLCFVQHAWNLFWEFVDCVFNSTYFPYSLHQGSAWWWGQ